VEGLPLRVRERRQKLVLDLARDRPQTLKLLPACRRDRDHVAAPVLGVALAVDAPLVRTTMAALRRLGVDPVLDASSTDANVPIALGIPAIALGAGGKAGDAHLASEWYENVEGALGIIRALLVTAAMAEVD